MIHTAKGTVLKFDATGVSYPTVTGPNIGQVRSITGPTIKPKVVDVTTHDTPGFWTRKLTVLIDGGDLSFEINWDAPDPSHDFTATTSMWYSMVGTWDITTQQQTGGLGRCALEMVFPYGAGDLSFYGYVSGHEFSVPVDNVLSAKIQLTITDAVQTTATIPVPPGT